MDDSNQSELQILDSEKRKDVKDFKVEIVGREECKRRCISKLKIIWSFLSFLISVADVTVIIYLSYLHFSHSQDLLAWLMLLPILLNFIGIFTFLSNETERKEMESLGCDKTKHLMFFPVVGPAFSALRLFSYAFEEENAEKFERLEALLTKMKQYEAFFRASPEAFIQITFRIVSWSNQTQLDEEDYWTSVCIALCMFALAESNIYGSVLPAYYRLFNYSDEENIWKTDKITISWRVGLFFFNYTSICSRLIADAIFRATACFYFTNLEFGEVIILTFIFQFLSRALLRAIYQNTLIRWNPDWKRRRSEMDATVPPTKPTYVPVQEDLSGVYGAFTYSWRCIFMSFDYQDWSDPIVFFWFYFENVMLLGSSLLVIYLIEFDLSNRLVYYVYTIASVVSMLIAIFLKYSMLCCWRRRKAKKIQSEKF